MVLLDIKIAVTFKYDSVKYEYQAAASSSIAILPSRVSVSAMLAPAALAWATFCLAVAAQGGPRHAALAR
eukprot:6187268-Pleurochrysis_carterae.AAC.2